MRLRFAAGAGAVWLVLAVGAWGQVARLPILGPAKPEAAKQAEPRETPEQARERISKLLEEARAQVEKGPGKLPAGIGASEAGEWRNAQAELAIAYTLQLRAQDELAKAQAARTAAEASDREWKGFDAPPPYSILRVDELRDAADAVRGRMTAAETTLAQLKQEAGRAQDELRRAEERVRRSENEVAAAAKPEDQARAVWRRELARIQVRAQGAAAVAVSLATHYRSEELAAGRAQWALLERQIAVARKDASFSEDDVAKARQRIESTAAQVRRELATIASEESARLREYETAQQALARVRANPAAKPAAKESAEARLRAAESWIESDRDHSNALRGMLQLGEEETGLWEERRNTFLAEGPEARRAGTDRLREAAQRAARRRAYVATLVRETRTEMAQVEARLSRLDLAPATVRYERDALAARRQALLAGERLQDAMDAFSRQLELWVSDADSGPAQRSLGGRLANGWLTLRDTLHRVWNFEIFAVEETTVVDGHPVTTARGVTVGKSVGALLVFLIGYWLIALLARRIERELVAHGFNAPRVRSFKRWVLAMTAFVLVLLVLNLARIPLTVFAFLGGALAIGVGFGTQTIIKNFISGMIVLMERRVQIGDIVEVEGITGTVTEVDLRASTLRGFDGVETIVPNSSLLENKVTNWTHSDRKVRRIVKVGVAYGSPVREVSEILEDCARRHGLVLSDPAPSVIFEDFGSDALMFGLYVWVELAPKTNVAQVLSDLRFMIEKRFGEAGIIVAYPQRDVHIETATPLRVELIGRGPSGASPRDSPARVGSEGMKERP